MDFGVRQFAGQRQSDASRAGADVEKSESSRTVEAIFLHQFKHGLYYMLSFRSRDQYRGRDEQIEPPEFLMSGDVLRGTATRSFTNHFVVARLVVFIQLVFRMGIEISSFSVE